VLLCCDFTVLRRLTVAKRTPLRWNRRWPRPSLRSSCLTRPVHLLAVLRRCFPRQTHPVSFVLVHFISLSLSLSLSLPFSFPTEISQSQYLNTLLILGCNLQMNLAMKTQVKVTFLETRTSGVVDLRKRSKTKRRPSKLSKNCFETRCMLHFKLVSANLQNTLPESECEWHFIQIRK
jgi:hypothetical protein